MSLCGQLACHSFSWVKQNRTVYCWFCDCLQACQQQCVGTTLTIRDNFYKPNGDHLFSVFIVCCLLVVVLVTMGMTLVFQGQTKQHVAANVMTAPKTPTTVNGPVWHSGISSACEYSTHSLCLSSTCSVLTLNTHDAIWADLAFRPLLCMQIVVANMSELAVGMNFYSRKKGGERIFGICVFYFWEHTKFWIITRMIIALMFQFRI